MTANLASVAFRTSPSEVYGFSFATTGRMTDAKIAEYRAIAESFSLLSPEELSEIRPYRVQVVTAGSLDTVESLAERSIYSDFAVERFRALNGLSGEIEAGDRLKLIVED
jgi:predicted Zn-dependent protease